MAEARRAAGFADDGDVVEAQVASARRGVPSRRGTTVRHILAPVTLLAVVGLAAAATVLPGTEAGMEHTDPSMAASSPFGVSRNFARPSLSPAATGSSGLPTVSTSPSASPSAASPSAASTSASASPSAVPSVAATSAAAAPAATAAATPTPAPVDYTALSASAGTRYTSDPVNVRVGPGVGYEARTTLAEAKAVEITEWAVDGWRQVVVSDKSGWIKESFLTADKPVVAVAKTAASSESGGSSSGFSTEACAAASGIESGLTSRTRAVLRAVCAEFASVTSYGGYRAGGGSYHSSGQAIDVMVSGEAGWEIARWARANASALGIIEVLYSQQIWTAQRSGDGWRGMEDRGSVSANHSDHVHISVG